MSPKVPRIGPSKAERLLHRLGFKLAHTRGSHKVYHHPNGRWVTIPFHAGHDLHPKTIKAIAEAAEITVEELIAEL